MRAFSATFLVVATCLVIVGCTVGPDYRRPDAPAPPESFKEAPASTLPAVSWRQARPRDGAPRGKWWESYNDVKLNALEDELTVANQNLKAATAQYLQAREQVSVARASYFPTVSAGPSVASTRESYNQANTVRGVTQFQFNTLALQGQVLWEPDLWGQIRRTVEQARANAQASAADLASVELSLRAELATDYFELRGLDAQRRLLDKTVASDADYLQLTQVRLRGGVGTEVDVAQAEAQYQGVQAQAVAIGVARAQYEHAIATLVGVPAPAFSLPAMPLDIVPPAIPSGLPSELLERRPDVAGAERRTAAANAQIGIAIAAYYPNITLGATGGLESGSLGTLLQWSSLIWSLGASAVETFFDAGRRRALTGQARHAYEAQTAQYRQSVLNAFQEVEDALAALRILNDEAVTEDAAVEASRRSLSISTRRYKGGVATYLEVLTAQTIQLANERARSDTTTRQCVASVQLIKAIGGGWDVSHLTRL